MNKITKLALCFGLAGLSGLIGTRVVSAGKPPAAPAVLTFLSGDVRAEPREVLKLANARGYISARPFTAAIDFAGYRPCPEHSPAGGRAVLDFLQSKNPITYDSLTISIYEKWGAKYTTLDFRVTIGDVPYTITMNVFLYGTITSTPTSDTYRLWEGRFAVMSKNELLVVAGPDRQADVEFAVTR